MGALFNIEATERPGVGKINEFSAENSVGLTEIEDKKQEEVSKTGQEIAEISCEDTKTEMMKEHGSVMSRNQIERLSNYEIGEKITVLSAEDYVEEFPEVPFNVIGHCDLEGNIYMKNISEYQVEHTAAHETMHLCSYRNIENNFYNSEERIGLRHTVRTAESFSLTKNRGINEGVTEMYTNRELSRRGGIERDGELRCYDGSQAWARRLEYMVGHENLERAYFGGEDIHLKVSFNDLNDNELDAWDRFSEDVDIVEYSDDAAAVQEANRRLSEQFAKMYINKISGGGRAV